MAEESEDGMSPTYKAALAAFEEAVEQFEAHAVVCTEMSKVQPKDGYDDDVYRHIELLANALVAYAALVKVTPVGVSIPAMHGIGELNRSMLQAPRFIERMKARKA